MLKIILTTVITALVLLAANWLIVILSLAPLTFATLKTNYGSWAPVVLFVVIVSVVFGVWKFSSDRIRYVFVSFVSALLCIVVGVEAFGYFFAEGKLHAWSITFSVLFLITTFIVVSIFLEDGK